MNFLNKLHSSRNVILEMIESRGFDSEKYKNFTIKEIDIMRQNTTNKLTLESSPLDISVVNDSTGSKLNVKYLLGTKPRLNNILSFVNEFSETEMKDGDSLVIISRDKLTNDTPLDGVAENLLKTRNIFVQLFWIDQVVVNITRHTLVPEHQIISQSEKEQLLGKYNIKSYNNLPIILKNDPVAKYYGMRRGDVCKITRPSETSGIYTSYRYCQ
jgi:DNA-directed RNA polymerases I, II, and III subunit RPABC1